MKKAKIAREILGEKKTNEGRLVLLDVKTHYKAIIIMNWPIIESP